MTTDAKDAAGYALIAEQVWSFTTTAVAAPTNLTAARSGSGSSQRINLSWTDTSSNETNFTVERCTDSSSYCASQVSWSVRTVTLAANTESYADAGLSRRTTYTYRVKATNSAESSQYSNTASATTTKKAK